MNKMAVKMTLLLGFAVMLVSCSNGRGIQRIHYQAHEPEIGYTQVVQQGNRLYLSGVTAPGPDMQTAVEKVYAAIKQILAKHGASMNDVVMERLYTTDMAAMKAQIPLRKKFYADGQYPAATWIEVKGLFMPEFILEVEVEAWTEQP